MQDGVVMRDYTHKTHTGITKKQFFSIDKANTKAAWHPVGIQQPPPPPHPPNLTLSCSYFESWNTKKRLGWKTCLAPIVLGLGDTAESPSARSCN